MKNILITILFTIISATVFAQLPRAGSVVGLTNGDTTFQSPLSAIFSALGGGATINATDDYIPKRLNSGAFTNSLMFSRGSIGIGIGTTTPERSLHIIQAESNPLILQRSGTNVNIGVDLRDDGISWSFGKTSANNFSLAYNTANIATGIFQFTPTGGFGVGTTTPSARIHALSTTEQQRLGYDASNYFSTTIGSTGSATLNLVGTSPTFNFSDPVNITGTTNVTGSIVSTGAITSGSSVAVANAEALLWTGRSTMYSPANGIIKLGNSTANDFDRLQFGGTTSSFPSIKRSTTNLIARLADDSANTDIEVLDEAYDATTWNGNNEVPTKNALRDKIETLSSPTNKVTKGGDTDAATLVVGTNDSQELHLETGGTARVFVTTTGLVGIKEPSPATTLHVNGNIRGDGKVLIRGTGNTSALTASQLGFLNSNGSSTYDVLLNDAASLEFTSNTAVKTLSLTNSGVTLGGGLTVATSTKTSSYTMAGTDYYIRIDGTSGTNIITLPSATTGRVVKFKRVDNNPATAVGFIGTINSTANPTSLSGGSPVANMTAQHAFLELTYNGTDWDITGSN